MKRLLVVSLLFAPVLGLVLPAAADPAGLTSIAPTTTAWYDATYPTTVASPPPAPPGVAAGDLVVAGTTVSASVLPVTLPDGVGTVTTTAALAALSFTVPPGTAAASLTLELTGAASTAAAGARTPTGVTPEACPATTTFQAGGRQAFDTAPTYDCSGRTSVGQFSSDGATVIFSDIARVANGQLLSFVIRPGTTGADRLVFAAPTATALSLLPFDTAPTFDPDGAVATPPPPAVVPPAAEATTGVSRVSGPLALLPPAAEAPGWLSVPDLAAPAPAQLADLRGGSRSVPDDAGARAAALAGLVLLVAAVGLLAFTDERSKVRSAWRPAVELPPGQQQEWGYGRHRGPRQGQAPAL